MIVLATLPISGLMTYRVFVDVSDQQARMQDAMLRNVKVLAQSVNRELASTINDLRILSYSETLQRGEAGLFEDELRRRPLMRPSWLGVYLVSLAGDVIFDTAPRGPNPYPTERNLAALWNRPLEQQALISDLVHGVDNNSVFTTVEVPVSVGGVPRYLLGARIPNSVWQELVEGSGIAAHGIAALFGTDKRLIARNLKPEIFIGKQLTTASQMMMDGHPAGSGRLTMFEGGHSYAAWESVPLSGWGVGIGMPGAPIDAAQNRAFAVALATVFGCLLLGVFLAFIVARKMTRPLHLLSSNKIPPPGEPIPVQEISLLRDALLAAHAQNQAAQDRLKFKRDLLQKRANEFETLLNSSPIGLAFAQDPQCREVVHNPAMDSLFGTTQSQATGVVCVLDKGRPLPRDEQPLQRAAAEGKATYGMELELLVDDRPPAFVIVNAVPLLDAEGKSRGAIGAVVDITARKVAESRLINAEQRLRESQRLVDLAQEIGDVGFFHYRFAENVLASTPGQAKLFGITDEEGIDTLVTWTQHIDRSDWRQILRRIHRAIKTRQEKETLNYSVGRADGSRCWLSSRVQLVYDADDRPQHMIGISVDMSEQKEAERERLALIAREQAARLDAEAANHSKDVFLAMLGHELRNPLSAIAAAIEVLNRVGAQSANEISARQILSRQTRHLSHMLDDLLDVARVISGQVNLTRQSLDLGARVQRVLDTLELTGQPHQHCLTLDLQEVWVDADATRIEQIVNNLVINAIKYTPPGGRIAIRVAADGDEALLEVRNSGPGISPALMPRIFDLFIQGERALDRRDGGLGVGLTLVRRLVELHGGSISAESVSQETLICVRLPAIEHPRGSQLSTRVSASRRRCVAVIEDNDDVLEGLRTLLEFDGHTVWTATDGVSGLALLLNVRPDLAVVDIGLPGLNGFEVAKRSRAGGYAGQMFALSGYGQASDLEQGRAAGFDHYILKPIDTLKLRALLESD